MLDDDIVESAKRLLDICKRKNLILATAESCTAGLVAGTLAEVPGISSMLDRGFITYSNQAKQDMLGCVSGNTGKAGRRQPRDRGRNGAWRPRPCARRPRCVGDGHCRPGRWFRRKAGRPCAFRGGVAVRPS